MVALKVDLVENEITKAIEEINSILKIDANINISCCPGNIGISSQILVTLMGRLEGILNVKIPDNCYIFHDRKSQKQLTIKEAAQKLIKEAIDGN